MIAEESIEYYRKLPHIQHIGASFFVTFRLYDSLPTEVVMRLKEDKDNAIQKLREKNLPESETIKEQTLIKQQYLQMFEELLDTTQTGTHYLKDATLAEIVVNKLKQYDGLYYELQAYCVMSNHVHVLLDFSIQIPTDNTAFIEENYVQLSKVMQLIKGGSSRLINQVLNQKGTLWQEENFDTYIRDERHKAKVIKYILNNPVKIGLVSNWCDFPFAWAKEL